MCLRLLFYHICLLSLTSCVQGHIPAYITTPSDRVQRYCFLSESCIHDTIRICGINNEQKKRTFLDLCDLLEYGCDTGIIYNHIDDTPDCPKVPTTPKPKI